MIRERCHDEDAGEQVLFAAASGARCPAVDLIIAAAADCIDDPVRLVVRGHVARCRACRILSDALTADEAVLPTADIAARIDAKVSSSIARASFMRSLGLAASILLALSAIFLSKMEWRTAPEPAPTAPSQVQPSRPVEFVLALEVPPVVLPESALTLRGGDPDPYARALASALAPYRRADFAAAARQLSGVAARFADRPHAHFYAGVSLLMTDRHTAAVASLERAGRNAGSDRWIADASAWYLAIALERSGDRAGAARVLAGLCDSGATRRDAACKGLQHLP